MSSLAPLSQPDAACSKQLGKNVVCRNTGRDGYERQGACRVRDISPRAFLEPQTGTVNAAELMGWSNQAGAREPGKWADVIAVQWDPLHDIAQP